MNIKDKISAIPHASGVYLMRDISGVILYVGKAIDLNKRVSSYFRGRITDIKTAALVSNIRAVDYLITGSEKEALVLEDRLIKRYQPRYNIMWRDDKSYPFVHLTLNEEFPRIHFTREKGPRVRGDGYYGPYPSVKEVTGVIKSIRKIFPLRYCGPSRGKSKKESRGCLYSQIGRCPAPCLGKIPKEDYWKTVSGLKLFLEGQYDNLKQLWTEEMKLASEKLEYEKALEIRKHLGALEYMFEKIHLRRLNSEADLQQHMELSRVLSGMKEELDLPRVPLAIEAFDVSNTSGRQPVGSMVRFTNGKPDKANYRKYKIRTVGGIDDFSMLAEVVCRRYARLAGEGSPLPDLALLDGGKGQLSKVMETLRALRIKSPPLASIAKKEEILYMPGRERGFREIRLPYDSKTLLLIQQVRDEAHRFALNFHKARRKKDLIQA